MYQAASELPIKSRRDDLDWLRVLAFIILIFFHVGMFFNYWGWHIKNNVITHMIEYPMRFPSQWRMALLFMISGAGVYFSLGSRTGGAFMKERFVRIFIPLAFGMFVIVPPQIYFERLTQGQTYSYGAFYKSVFDFIPYPHGSFSWHHLWYLAYIFLYSLIALPLLLYIRNHHDLTAKWARFFSNPFALIGIPVVWHMIGNYFLAENYPNTNNLTRDWNNHFHSLTLFITGFVLCTQTTFWDTLLKYRKLTLTVWIILTSILYGRYWLVNGPEGWLYSIIQTANAWCILLCIFGYGYRYLRFSTPFLKYANEAVYPFYILHQTVIIILAYPIIGWQAHWFVKFCYLSVATFLICLALYHFLIKRIDLLRALFGMKTPKTKRYIGTETAEVIPTADR